MNDKIEKTLIDGVYTLTGIRSAYQVKDFYDEVVKGNYEKYVCISVQGLKFGYNIDTDKCYRLGPGVEFAINPRYNDNMINKAEEDVKEDIIVDIEPEVEPVAVPEINAVEEVPVVAEEEIKVEEQEPIKEETEIVEPKEEVIEEKVDDSENIINELKTLLAIKEEQIGQKDNELSLLREAKLKVEGELEITKNKLAEALITTKESSLDDLISAIQGMGYKVYVTK